MLKHEGVDELGFILTVGNGPVQPEFQALVEDVLATLITQIGNSIHGIYLYGSIARGDAVLRSSDLDVTIVLRQVALPDQDLLIKSMRRTLQDAHPEVVKIDFDIGVLADVTAADKVNSWGYWFKHHCRCIWGIDLAVDYAPFKPSKAIALAVNGDFHEILDGYAERIENASDQVEAQHLKRAAARKLIRATNILRPDCEQSWPQGLSSHVDLFLKSYPAMADSISYFLAEANGTYGTPYEFVARLRTFALWLRAQH
ncbi:MAG: nucleotidyltransferase domain-containing protein [Collimonas sp.]|uniref:nucleotidyltransferase domain-containing protein n=1 Tax=Collimonas sp. TaxID=1963772 RepID=UPI0032647B37